MNLKDRLSSNKENPPFEQAAFLPQSFIEDIFVKDDKASNILEHAVNSHQNIIFISGKDCDKSAMIDYIQSFINKDEKIVTHIKLTDKSYINDLCINIIREPSISEIVKIFELILYGYKSFIFCINLNSYKNAAEKIRTLIAVNFKNLSENTINTLVGASEALVVNVDINNDGLFFVTDVGKLEYSSKNLLLTPVYNQKDIYSIDMPVIDVNPDEDNDEIYVISDSDLGTENIFDNETKMPDNEESVQTIQIQEMNEDNTSNSDNKTGEGEQIPPTPETKEDNTSITDNKAEEKEQISLTQETKEDNTPIIDNKTGEEEQFLPVPEIKEHDVLNTNDTSGDEEKIPQIPQDSVKEEVIPEKINKYKLLREKVRQKRAI